MQIGLLYCPLEVKRITVWVLDVAHIQFAIEGSVDAVAREGWVEEDHELGLFHRP